MDFPVNEGNDAIDSYCLKWPGVFSEGSTVICAYKCIGVSDVATLRSLI